MSTSEPAPPTPPQKLKKAPPKATPVEVPPVEAGELSLSEMRLLEQLRVAGDNLVREIGALEIRKAGLLTRFNQIDAQAQGVLLTAAKRLGIPPEETWQVTPEGKVLRGNTPPA